MSDQYITYYVEDYVAADYYADELYYDGDYLVAGYYEGEQVVVTAQADLVAQTVTTANAGRKTVFASTMVAQTSVTALGLRDRDIFMSAFDQSTVSTEATRQRDNAVTTATSFAIALDYIVQKDSGANLASEHTQTVIYQRNRDTQTATQVAFAVSAEAQATVSFDTATQSTFNLTADAGVVKSIASAANANSTVTAIPTKQKQISSTISSQTELAVRYLKWTTRFTNPNRPLNMQLLGSDMAIVSNPVKWGTGALQAGNDTRNFGKVDFSGTFAYPQAGQNFVFEFWVRNTAANSVYFILGNQDGFLNDTTWGVGNDASGNVYFRFREPQGTDRTIQSSIAGPTSSEWKHIAVRRSGSTIQLLVDSVVGASTSYSGAFLTILTETV